MSAEWPQPEREGQKDGDKKAGGDAGPAAAPARARGPAAVRLYQIAVAVLALLSAAIYVYMALAKHELGEELRDARAAWVENTSEALTAQAEELLRLEMTTLTLATAPALGRGDHGEVQRIIEVLVKERHVAGISVADDSGTIVAATNKKWEGTNIEGVFPGLAASSGAIEIRARDDDFMVTGPVTQKDQRVGTVVLLYSRKTVRGRVPPGAPPEQ